MTKKKFIYGKIIHLILESGKKFKSIEELDKYLKRKYKPKNEYFTLDKQIKDKLLKTIWKKINTSPAVNYYNFIRNKLESGYKPLIEKPILSITVSGKTRIRYKYNKYIPDIVLWNPNTKSLIVIEIKSGTKRRKKTNKKQLKKYIEALKKIFKPKKVEGYLYYFKSDDLIQVL